MFAKVAPYPCILIERLELMMVHQLREKNKIIFILWLLQVCTLTVSYTHQSYISHTTLHNPSHNIMMTTISKRVLSIKNRPLHYAFASCNRRSAFFSRICSHSVRSSVISLASMQSSDNNYYTSASSISTSSSTFPKWWSESTTNSSISPQEEYIKFEHHVAHVIVPKITDNIEEHDDTISSAKSSKSTTTTCGEIIQWVLKAEKDRKPHQLIAKDAHSTSSSTDQISQLDQQRIQAEYNEGEEVSTSLKVLDPAYRHDPALFPQDSHNNTRTNLNAAQLLALGSVWYLPLSSSTKSTTIDRFDPKCGVKPTRLNIGDWNKTIKSGEYLRIHFDPRRFVDTNLYDWGTTDGILNDTSGKPGVVVARDDEAGYIIINKPCNIPVHARVDNVLENVASSIGRMLWLERRESLLTDGMNKEIFEDDEDEMVTVGNHTYKRRRRSKQRKQKIEPLVYVATPQRLDQNTSGLLVVGTKKTFAAYFAKLLRTKTNGQLKLGGSTTQYSSNCGVHKTYKCLVCISPQASTSMVSEVNRLKGYTNEIMKHYLEPSIRAPKRFVESVPDDVDNVDAWAECLLRITNVTTVCTVVGNEPSDTLAKSLWGEYGKPDECVGIAELEIELLTGRTHQIRGQLAATGFPLVGDVQYDGAIPNTSELYKERCKGRVESFLDSERLALQCCSLEFLDPNHDEDSSHYEKQKKSRRSERWNSFRLDHAFWSPFIIKFDIESADVSSSDATSSLDDKALLLKQAATMEDVDLSSNDPAVTHDLPPRVVLSPGSHKYVVIRATLAEGDSESCFVRSASPEECGGPYHANVAEEVLHQLHTLGYLTQVMGGGRIDYIDNEEVKHAHVFGFSYGFGKGDHEKVASIIEQYSDVIATFDNSNGLY